MPLSIACPFCNAALEVPDHLAGSQASCYSCTQVMTVPAVAPRPVHRPPQEGHDYVRPARRRQRPASKAPLLLVGCVLGGVVAAAVWFALNHASTLTNDRAEESPRAKPEKPTPKAKRLPAPDALTPDEKRQAARAERIRASEDAAWKEQAMLEKARKEAAAEREADRKEIEEGLGLLSGEERTLVEAIIKKEGQGEGFTEGQIALLERAGMKRFLRREFIKSAKEDPIYGELIRLTGRKEGTKQVEDARAEVFGSLHTLEKFQIRDAIKMCLEKGPGAVAEEQQRLIIRGGFRDFLLAEARKAGRK